jgi:hypothetical protein
MSDPTRNERRAAVATAANAAMKAPPAAPPDRFKQMAPAEIVRGSKQATWDTMRLIGLVHQVNELYPNDPPLIIKGGTIRGKILQGVMRNHPCVIPYDQLQAELEEALALM